MADHTYFDGEINRIFTDGTMLSEHSEFVKRNFVHDLMNLYVPSDYRDIKFSEITQGRAQAARKQKKFFSTCGELVMFVLYRMGYRGKILNRKLAAGDGVPKKKSYRFGANMSRVFGTSKKEGVWVPNTKGLTPNMGDCCFVANFPNSKTEHVFVFLEEFQKDGQLYWRTWDAGQGGRITQAAKMRERKVKGKKLGSKTCHGWINIDKLELTCPATLEVDVG
jgi:hypothetical protein